MGKELLHLTKGDADPPQQKGLLRLYGMRFCPYDHRVKLVLDTKKIPYDSVHIKLSAKPDWFAQKGTYGKVPTLQFEDGRTIAESLVIADYLDEAYPEPPLYSNDLVTKAQDKLLTAKFSAVSTIFHKLISTNESCTQECFQEFIQALLPFEQSLAARGTAFFGGSKPGMVDLMIWPWLERTPMVALMAGPSFQLPKERFPRLSQWSAEMLLLPQVQQNGLTPAQHKKFFDTRRGPSFYDFDYDVVV